LRNYDVFMEVDIDYSALDYYDHATGRLVAGAAIDYTGTYRCSFGSPCFDVPGNCSLPTFCPATDASAEGR
jgi:hypothetical protein